MTSKERVMKALRREKSDRPACDLRCTPEVWEALFKYFNLEKVEDVLDKLDIDMRWITAGSLPYIGPKERSAPTLGGEGADIFGCVMKASSNKYNTYYEFTKHPLAHCKTVEEIYEYEWPSLDWYDYSKVKEIVKSNKKTDDRAIMFFAGGTFETPWYMRGMEQFFIDLYDNPEIVNAICTKVGEYFFKRALRVLEAADNEIDIIGSGGDIGGQECLMLNPDVWREQIKPHTAGLLKPFKQMGLSTFYHSCGSVAQVINDLADIGMDMLDPIQVTAKNMTPEYLAHNFADRISFHGAIDEVELLPHASPLEVYNETQRIISILGKNGGFIVSPSHQVQGDTSIENILALFKSVHDFRYD
ncbi:MAG TPA: uroporphyrinogen decarboxylase family protein [Clostridia bacterium]|jgi:uroporphyrinogen decarboxylase|nr:MAG: methylcobalamin:coenzyme M methyltransferase [Firmicutes bacterium ADurb.Bin146]HOD92603.1 uroporphyrinogen decarboxylase family protein [Clostridia bacterium]HQM39965.1 uroporphyrinogen decarboxylase family protein [Clostridia bacterium]